MAITVRKRHRKGRPKPWIVTLYDQGTKTERGFKTELAADQEVEETRAKITLGLLGPTPKPKQRTPAFKAYAEKYMDTYSRINHKEITRNSYRSVLDNHLYPTFGDTPLHKITRKDIKAFLIQKQASGLSPRSVEIMKSYLSGILTEALDDELIQLNPASRTGGTSRRNRPINPTP